MIAKHAERHSPADTPVKILLIDDNPHDRVLLERELTMRVNPVRVSHVRSAEDLEAALRAEEPDLAITDYQLHWGEGIEVLRQLKARWPTRPVIMFTASGSEEIAAQAMKEGLDDYITKTPKHFARIPYAVASCLERAAQREALETALASLRESEARFRHMAEAMPQILFAADGLGAITYVNERWREYTGFADANEEVWAHVLCDADRERLCAKWRECRAAGEPLEAEFRMRRASDGSYRWFLARAVPMRGNDGLTERWTGTVTDIHDQKRAAEELKEADRRKDEFLATLAHELRNPLAPIRNAAQFLRIKGSGDPDVQNARTIIDRQVRHMVRLVDDLLDVSRISLGKIHLQKEQVSLANVLSIALEAVRPLVEAARHELAIFAPAEPIYVKADITRLSQVFGNLLNNAIKYTPAGGRISVQLLREEQSAVLSVRDNGVGIPAGHLAHIFDLFAQVPRSSERVQEGLGIGLTLARQLVEMHQGTLTARSEGEGCGSEFVVRLPVHEEPLAPVPGGSLTDARADAQLSGQRILVIDDNQDAADSLAMVLALSGCDVRKAYDGLDAIQTAREFSPDAILLDIGMPKLDGYQVCRRIRQEPWGRHIIMLALTGWGQSLDRRRTQETGFDAHLVKPVEPHAVLTELQKLLRSRAAGS
jgi:PAS domain S-box-containing protein